MQATSRKRTRGQAGQASWWAGLPGILFLIALVLAPLIIIVIYVEHC